MPHTPIVFAPLFAAALALFGLSCWRRFRLVALGGPDNRFDRPLVRLGRMFSYAFAQARVVSRPFGINHLILFWAFIVLLIANGEFLLNGLFPELSFALLPPVLRNAAALVIDLVSAVALASILASFARRLFFVHASMETRYVKARSRDALLILSFVSLLLLALFGIHGAQIAGGVEPAGAFMPVAGLVARAFTPLSAEALALMADALWWVHAVVLLLFLNYLPFGKHMHILTAIPNCYFQSLDRPNAQPREEFAQGKSYGAAGVQQLSWKDLFDSYTCTECGRCQEACPAWATEKPLNPRQVVHDIKINLLKNGPALRAGGAAALPLIGGGGEGSVAEEALWSCTTCGACMEACPVFIQQMPKIIKMRRHLVEMEARFPDELLNLFEFMEQRNNPWGIAPSERTKWASQLSVKPFVAGQTEYLFYVGCAGATDSHGKLVAVAIARLLDAAGLSWGILGREEKCCGDSMRRLGNEYVFDRMARENVALLRGKGATKIITYCPHCYSTLANDYRQFGLEAEIIHHSVLLRDLLSERKLRLSRKIDTLGTIVFHDSCYMGRHNSVYDAPREAIRAATGRAAVEMPRSRANSFCCGAGGGRMRMEENSGTRINRARVRECLEQKPDTVCVICPYCTTMFEDGLKTEGAKSVRVKDIAEVLVEGLPAR